MRTEGSLCAEMAWRRRASSSLLGVRERGVFSRSGNTRLAELEKADPHSMAERAADVCENRFAWGLPTRARGRPFFSLRSGPVASRYRTWNSTALSCS